MSVNNNHKRLEVEARALATMIFIIAYFITINIIPIYAPEYFANIFSNLTIIFTSVIMNFYGAKNGEKRLDQMLNQLPLMVASQTARELVTSLKPLLSSEQKKVL